MGAAGAEEPPGGGCRCPDRGRVCHLDAGLAARGERILVVDLDPQGGCAVSLGISPDSLDKTVYTALMRDTGGPPHGFHLAPSNIDLAGAEVELRQMLAAEQILKCNLEPVPDKYDFILFDCSTTSLGMLTINALTTARELLIPMSMELLALRGLDMLARTFTKIHEMTNPELSYSSILAAKRDRRSSNSPRILVG